MGTQDLDKRLVRARAPLRLGLAGGGTDVSPYCDLHGGCVLNATIDMYAHVTIQPYETGRVCFTASDQEVTWEGGANQRLEFDGKLDLHKGVYNRVNQQFNGGQPLSIKVTTHCDAPPGSGLGSSSTLVVAMLKAYQEMLNLPFGDYELAHLAYEIERLDVKLAGGKQDQYAAAFGGFNFIEFYDGGRVLVNPLRIKNWIISEIESSLVLFFTGVSRSSAAIIDNQSKNVAEGRHGAIDALHALKEEALHMKEGLLKGDFDIFVSSMRRSWESKKQTASEISNDSIENIYKSAMAAGARTGKVSGAGGGGFMMLFVDPSRRPQVVRSLQRFPGQVFNCHFVKTGSQGWKI